MAHLWYLNRQSYDVTIDLHVEGSGLTSSNTLDLKNPYFRYAGQPAAPPPGNNTTSPSEAYWAQLDVQGARQGSFASRTVGSNNDHSLTAVTMVNGMTVNGLGEVTAIADATATNANSSLLGLGKQLTNYLILGTHSICSRFLSKLAAFSFPHSSFLYYFFLRCYKVVVKMDAIFIC